MSKFKKWLVEKYLPAYAKETILEDNKKLQRAVESQQQTIAELRAYIEGLESANKIARRIVINNGRGE